MASSKQYLAIQMTRASPSDAPALSLEKKTVQSFDDDHVLVQVKAASVQPSDRLNARGGFGSTVWPRVPGRDFSGKVVDGPPGLVGKDVWGTGGIKLGFQDDGTSAEMVVVHKKLIAEKPASMSYVQAASIGVPYTTADLCLRRARATSNDTVLVLGASGSVGGSAVQIARAMKCKHVLGAARHGNCEINLQDDPELKSVSALTDGKGVDVIVDTVGDLTLMKQAIARLAQGGRYAFISAPRAPGASTELSFDIFNAYRRELELVGCNSVAMTPDDLEPSLSQLSKWFASGDLSTRLDSELQTTSIEDALKTYATGKGLQFIVF